MKESPFERKTWQYARRISEHAFDKLRLLDCGFGEFEAALMGAEVIESRCDDGEMQRELLLVVGWRKVLHVAVAVDHRHQEERVLTIYEPDPHRWSADYRTRQ